MLKEYSFKLKIDNEKLVNQMWELEKECHDCREFKKFKELWLMQCEEMLTWKNLYK